MSYQNVNHGKMKNSQQKIDYSVVSSNKKNIPIEKDLEEDDSRDGSDVESDELEVNVDKRIKFYTATKLSEDGDVYTCFLDKKQEVALKKINVEQINLEDIIGIMEKLKENSHHNVVKYLHHAVKNKSIYIALELGNKINLMEFENLKNLNTKFFFKSIVYGLEYLHNHEIGMKFNLNLI